MNFEICTSEEVLKLLNSGEEVYILTKISDATTIKDIKEADILLRLPEEKEGPAQDSDQGKEKEKKKGGSNRKYDYGKIKALRTAGWTAPQIADEIGCSIQQIYKILNKLSEEEIKEDEAKNN